jgi:hypothetical protein
MVAMLGVVFCYSGAAMAGSFTVSNPERLDHWRFVATVYQVLTGVCSIAAIVIFVMLSLRRRVTRTPRRDNAGSRAGGVEAGPTR